MRATHAAQAGRQDPAPGQVAAEVLACGLGEGFISALHDALRADVDPRPRCHLPVHEQAAAIEFVEVLPGRPLRHEVGIGEQHPRCTAVSLEHAHGLARLNQQRLVVVQFAQAFEDLVERRPVARGTADAAVHHEILRALSDVGIEVVLDHPVCRFGEPGFA